MDKAMTSETLTSDLPASKPDEDTVILMPVPPEDIMKCAKPRCGLCYGRGKLTFKEVGGGDKSEVSVCSCALKRFVAQNHAHLAVSRDKKLFYRQVPESLAGTLPETESSEESAAPITDNEDAQVSRFRVIKDRLARLDEELLGIAKRYDSKLEGLLLNLLAAETDLEKQQEGWKGDIEARKIIVSSLDGYDHRIAAVENELRLLRGERVIMADLLIAADETLGTMQTALAPYHRALDKAKEDVATMEKKKHQAMKPNEQRKASLLKRAQRKAASAGMSIEDMVSKAVASNTEL